MSKYRITDRNTGTTLEVDSNHAPSEQEIEDIFRQKKAGGRETKEKEQEAAGPATTVATQQKQEGGTQTALETKGEREPVSREETRKTLAEAGAQEEGAEKQDVVLDVPTLKVDEIKLDVDDLNARVALNAELANLVRIAVGANVSIAKVALDIKGVEAQALLKVRLKQVANIISRALETIDRNPELLRSLLQPVGQAVGETGKQLGGAVGQTGKQLGGAVGETGKQLGGAVGETGKQLGRAGQEKNRETAARRP